MFILTLKTGRQIFVDDEDKHYLEKYHLNTIKPRLAHTRYVVCTQIGTAKYVGLLHRIILNICDERIVDHKNGNGLDCQKTNLRISNGILNQQNRRVTIIENEVRGLYFRKDRGYWIAKITVNKKQIWLGSFHNKDDAIEARLNAEDKYFGANNGEGTTYVQL